MKHIRITPYDPKWPEVYKAEAELIRQTLLDNCTAVHHVGSTAVPGLAAKPKIDIIAVVRDGQAAVSALENAGYTYKGEWNIPFKFGVTKRGEHAFNLHVYEEGHPEITLNLMFRDRLRTRPETMAAYAALKHDLLGDASAYERSATGFANYTLRKSEFIKGVLKEAGFDLMRMMKCNDEAEWQAARHFRDTYFFKP